MAKKKLHLDKEVLKVVNEELGSTLDHYNVHHDMYSFSKLFELHKTCKSLKITAEDIPRLDELKKLVSTN